MTADLVRIAASGWCLKEPHFHCPMSHWNGLLLQVILQSNSEIIEAKTQQRQRVVQILTIEDISVQQHESLHRRLGILRLSLRWLRTLESIKLHDQSGMIDEREYAVKLVDDIQSCVYPSVVCPSISD